MLDIQIIKIMLWKIIGRLTVRHVEVFEKASVFIIPIVNNLAYMTYSVS